MSPRLLLHAACGQRYYHRRAPEPTSAEMRALLARYESIPPRPLNLAQLLSFGRPVTAQSVLSSGSYALSELPRRLATRVKSLEALPFIVGTNPYVAKTLKAYKDSFKFLATYPPVTNLQENAEFVGHLAELVQRHANDIPTMAKGCAIPLTYKFVSGSHSEIGSRNAPNICLLQISATSSTELFAIEFLSGSLQSSILPFLKRWTLRATLPEWASWI